MKNLVKILAAFLMVVTTSSIYAKSLVVYYSLTGTTKELAGRIALETGSDLFELELKKPYSRNMSECDKESKADRLNKVQRELKAQPDLSKYDTVFIGSPVWSNDLANPVETWILQNQKELGSKTVVPFCTWWTGGNEFVLTAIKNLSTSKSVKPGLSQRHGEKADVKAWIEK